MPEQPTPLGVLTQLEHKYRIDRQPLESALKNAIAEQAQFDAWAEEQGRPVTVWRDAAEKIEYRRKLVLQAVQRLIQEMTEAPFAEDAEAHLLVRVRFLGDVLNEALYSRAYSARFLEAIARMQSVRKAGRPGQHIINQCLKTLIDDMKHHGGQRVPARDRRSYVTALAQLCGVLSIDARAPKLALKRRLQRIKPPDVDRAKRQRLQERWLQPSVFLLPPLLPRPSRLEEAPMATAILKGNWLESHQYGALEPPIWAKLETETLNSVMSRKSKQLKQSGTKDT